MKTINKKTGEDVTSLFLELMKKKITNKQFEELTGLEPSEGNPSRKSWEERNLTK